MFKIRLEEYYNLLHYILNDKVDEFDLVEQFILLHDDIAMWADLSYVEEAAFIQDNTTRTYMRQLKVACKKIRPQVEKLSIDFETLTDEMLVIIRCELGRIVLALTILQYTIGGYEEVIRDIATSGSLQINSGRYTTQILEVAANDTANVYKTASIISLVLREFKPFLPEYDLDEDELDTVYEAMEDLGIPSDHLTRIGKDLILEILQERG
jgi:hypothetical protein